MRNIQEVKEMEHENYRTIIGGDYNGNLQQQIIEELKVKPKLIRKKKFVKVVDFMKEYLKKHPFLKVFVMDFRWARFNISRKTCSNCGR